MSQFLRHLEYVEPDPRPPSPLNGTPFTSCALYNNASASLKSLHDLVALTNDHDLYTERKSFLWRDIRQPPIPLNTIQLCLQHALRGAARAGVFAAVFRAGINIFILIFRVIRAPRKFRLSAILHALLGADTFRFSAMLASFAFIYKFVLNSLPLLPIHDQLAILRLTSRSKRSHPVHEERDQPSQQASIPLNGYHLSPIIKEADIIPTQQTATAKDTYSRLDVSRWRAAVAGALAGLSIVWEKKSRRKMISQQLFVRGLQGTWNAWSPRWGIHVPYGSTIVFGLCCGQIMYSFLLRPDAIPRSYYNWILAAARVHSESFPINRTAYRIKSFPVEPLEALMKKPGNTPKNMAFMHDLLARAKMGDFSGSTVTCETIHPWVDSCWWVEVDRFAKVFTWMFPMYGVLHVMPMLLFRRKMFAKAPLKMLLLSFKGTVQSSTFLGVFVFIYQSLMCMRIQGYSSKWAQKYMPAALREGVFMSRASWWLAGAMCGWALLVEDARRRTELTMYVLPRALESAWVMLRGKGVLPFIPAGGSLLCAIGMGMVMSTYQCDPEHLSGFLQRVLFQFIGPN